MKTRFYLCQTLTFVTFFALFSCQDQDEVAHLETNSEISVSNSKAEVIADDISVNSGYVSFATTDAFENILGEDNAEEKSVVIKKLKEASFTSWRESRLSDSRAINGRTEIDERLLEDDFLSSIMNEDGILQIGKYLFKIDLNHEIVLALAEEDNEYYNDLVNSNTENDRIMIFSTNDEVLTLLEEGSKGTIKNGKIEGIFCSESHAEKADDDEVEYYGDGYRMICTVYYFKAGVYFKLEAKVRNQIQNAGIWMAQQGNMAIEMDCGYKPRCKDTVYKSDYTTNGGSGNDHKRVPYESTKGLNKLYYRAKFYNLASSDAVSRILEIRRGM